MPDKWEQYAEPQKGADKWAQYAEPAPAPPTAGGTPPPLTTPKPDLQKVSLIPGAVSDIGHNLLDFYTGAGRGFASTANNIGKLVFPDALARKLNMPVPNEQQQQSYFAPKNTREAIGKGAEQIGEFMLPGAGEERLASMAPRALRPAARIGLSALSSGGVNAAQGGSFTTGAAAGAAGAGLGAGMRGAAPYAAETAMRIPAAARAFGKTPGKAILEETRGITPSTVGRTARESVNNLTGELESMANQASARRNPARALLPAPTQEIPLAANTREPRMRPMAFNAQIKPEEPMEPRSGEVLAPISEFPGINPHYLSGSAHPELSGRVPTAQGVLIRPQQVPIGAGPIPNEIPSPTASLRPARGVIGSAMETAVEKNAASTHGQLTPMQDFLSRRFNTGEAIPENITPRDLLNLKRGFSDEFLGRWNPEIHEGVTNTGRQAYRALDTEFDRAVPGGQATNQRISSLIPVLRAADKAERAPSLFQRAAGRLAAHTGALTLGGLGAAGGYREAGLPGAVAGGAIGVLGPEVLASPEAQMRLARSLYSARGLRPAIGTGLQFTRGQKTSTEGKGQ